MSSMTKKQRLLKGKITIASLDNYLNIQEVTHILITCAGTSVCGQANWK